MHMTEMIDAHDDGVLLVCLRAHRAAAGLSQVY